MTLALNVVPVSTGTGPSDAAKPAVEIAGILKSKLGGDTCDAFVRISKGRSDVFQDSTFVPGSQVLTESSGKKAFQSTTGHAGFLQQFGPGKGAWAGL